MWQFVPVESETPNQINTVTTSVTPNSTISIVRCSQGTWRWQTPYEVVTYVAEAGRDNVLRWQRAGRRMGKITYDRAINWFPAAGEGGLHNRPVTPDRDRDAIYSDDTH